MSDETLSSNDFQRLMTQLAQGGEDPNIIHVDARGAALDSALQPLIDAGVITWREALMLQVCLKWGQYPAVLPTSMTGLGDPRTRVL